MSLKPIILFMLLIGHAAPSLAQFAAEFSLNDLDGNNGFVINGASTFDFSGSSVSQAGDVNGDGIGDIIIGASGGNAPGAFDAGFTYVVFGSEIGFDQSFNLSDINGHNGFVIAGVNSSKLSGRSVSTAGDINGDGIDDVIMGAIQAKANGHNDAGKSFVVFGSNNPFPSLLKVSDIDGTNGIVINGANGGDESGISVSKAGDVNDDGVDDVIIGAHLADSNSNSSAGSSYVVFGSDKGLAHPINLSDLDGTDGFVIKGISEFDFSGSSVSQLGDINGDGIDDVIIGAYGAEPNGIFQAGNSYVVFGQNSGFTGSLNLSDLNGINGFVIEGINNNDQSGKSVSKIGDINGDGIDDVLIGAEGVDENAFDAGSSYVIFGNNSDFPNQFNLESIDGMNGFIINGENGSDFSGHSVSQAGDFNGDGIDDLIIGAYGSNPDGQTNAGRAYVVYGNSSILTHPLNLSDLDGKNGFIINGINNSDESGSSVSQAGDVNGDGIDDILIGAPFADPNNQSSSGSTYVIFGRTELIFKDGFE